MLRPLGALALILGASSACQQVDQRLPFELDGGSGQTTIGASGGVISLPPNFSMQVPSGALTSNLTVTASERLTAFPAAAGVVVSGLMFDVGPVGTQLNESATVQIAVDSLLLLAGDELSLSIVLLTQSGSLVVPTATYDLSSGLLTAQIDELGALAAVVSPDAIPINFTAPPNLGGGNVSPAPTPVGPAALPPQYGGAYFAASCSTSAQQCFSSGIVEIWADDVVREHLGQDMVLMNTTVSGSIEFFAFVGNLPTQVIAELHVTGELRTRLNRSVVGRRVEDEVHLFTGGGSSPAPTAVTFTGTGSSARMTLAQTSDDSPMVIPYSVTGVGTGELLTLRLEGDLTFTDENGNDEIGVIVAHVRLRR